MNLPRPCRIVSALFGLAFLTLAGASPAEPLIVGQCAPLSGSLAGTGKEMVLGVRLAIDAANAAGGVHGRPLKHVVKDDGYRTAETLRLTEELVERDRAVALVGYAGTGNIAELLKNGILSRSNVPLVAPYTGGEALRTPFNPWIYHIRAGYGDETEAMVEQLVNTGIQRIAVFHQNDAVGEAGLAGVEKALARHKLQIVSKGSYEKNTEAVADAVARIARGAPQAVILVGIVRPVGAFIKAYLAEYPGTQMFSLSVVSAAELSQVAGDSARGVGITQVMPSPFNDHLRVVKDYQGALARFAPGSAPSYTSFEEYVGTRALIEALRNAGPNPGPAALHKALAALDTDLGGFKLRFSADNRVGSRFVDITFVGREGKVLR